MLFIYLKWRKGKEIWRQSGRERASFDSDSLLTGPQMLALASRSHLEIFKQADIKLGYYFTPFSARNGKLNY